MNHPIVKKKIPLSSIGGHQHPHVVDGCGPEVLLGQTPKNKFGTAHFFPFDKCFIVVRLLHHVEKCVVFHLLYLLEIFCFDLI
jgi:hypothetical protein